MTEYEKKKSPSQRETDTQWGRVTAFQTKWTKKHQAQIPVNDLIIKKKKKSNLLFKRKMDYLQRNKQFSIQSLLYNIKFLNIIE